MHVTMATSQRKMVFTGAFDKSSNANNVIDLTDDGGDNGSVASVAKNDETLSRIGRKPTEETSALRAPCRQLVSKPEKTVHLAPELMLLGSLARRFFVRQGIVTSEALLSRKINELTKLLLEFNAAAQDKQEKPWSPATAQRHAES